MTYPRSHLVDRQNGGCYHCISRCVRQAWLCGCDTHSGRSFEHRSAWLEERILMLAGVFAVDVYAYAVMSNHYHVVVHVRPEQAEEWCDLDVARRWTRVCSPPTLNDEPVQVQMLAEDPARISRCRDRLASLSWFMRFINEPMARIANREDERSGRFWDGRFRSIALLDEAALMACIVYVDLNPVRAGVADSPEQSRWTSVRHRMTEEEGEGLIPFATSSSLVPVPLDNYLELLGWIAAAELGRKITPPDSVEAVLKQSNRSSGEWLTWMRSQRSKHRAYGSAQALQDYAASIGQHWIKQ